MQKAPGKAFREGIALIEIMDLFPTEQAATKWFETHVWPNGRHCGHCGSVETKKVPNAKPMPYWCRDCKSYFSVRTGTALERSKVPLRKWAIAIYICVTSLKSVSSMKLHRDLKVTQKTAWFMLHRLREAWAEEMGQDFTGPVEADETYVGGKRKNMSNAKRKELAGTGRGATGKEAVVGTKDRETNKVAVRHVDRTAAPHLAGFVAHTTKFGSKVYTDESKAYNALNDWYDHESVNHSAGEYVRGMAHTNGMESFWAMLKRAHGGTFHKISPKHLQRYAREFAGKHNFRGEDTAAQMAAVAAGLVGRRLMYRDLTAENGLSSGARS